MFKSARLKLTGWYLLIMAIVCGAFSLVIFRVLTNEVDRFARMQQSILERRLGERGIFIPHGGPMIYAIDPDIVDEAKDRIGLALIGVNIGILVLAGALGYALAGKTLQPISVMVDDQKRFVSDASHELRTPLTALKASMEVFLRDKRAGMTEAKQLVSDNISQVNEIQTLTDALLQLSRFGHVNNGASKSLIAIKATLEEAIKKVEPIAIAKKIKINSELTDANIKGFKEEIVGLWVILLENAIKYSPAETQINVVSKKTSKHVNVEVHDQGMGISAEDLPHIWDRFFRADRARLKTRESGFGLGLSIAKKVVSGYGGTISVTSKEGVGSVFKVSFRIAGTEPNLRPTLQR